jgi:serine/threonine protein kinase
MPPMTVETARRNAISLDRYEVQNCIGMGQFARVFVGVDTVENRMVAIKMLTQPQPCSGEAFKMTESVADFLHEIAVLQHLSRSEVPSGYIAHGFMPVPGTRKERGFVVMELMPTSMMKRLMEGRPSMQTVMGWAADLATMVAMLHALRVIHRDIKVSNVCIDRNGGAQLVDFGLSIQLPRKHLTDYQAEDRVGVMGYMAPEVYQRQPYGFAVDVFSLGVVLQKLMNAAKPPSCEQRVLLNGSAAMFDLCPSNATYRRFTRPRVHKDWPQEMVDLVRGCCAWAPQDRPNAGKVAAELKSLRRGWIQTEVKRKESSLVGPGAIRVDGVV